MGAKITRIFDRILDVSAALAGVVTIFIMLGVSVDVVFRYFLYSPIRGMDEISEVLLLYITFLGTAWLQRRGGHIVIDVVFTQLKPKIQRWLTMIYSVIGAIISLILVLFGTLATLDVYQRGTVTPTILEIPRAAIFVIIPLGSLLLMFQFLRRAWSAHAVG